MEENGTRHEMQEIRITNLQVLSGLPYYLLTSLLKNKNLFGKNFHTRLGDGMCQISHVGQFLVFPIHAHSFIYAYLHTFYSKFSYYLPLTKPDSRYCAKTCKALPMFPRVFVRCASYAQGELFP
jgi:hypothetical protein